MPGYAPRSKRARRQNLVRAAIWVLLLLFVGSVVGVAIVTVRAH
jgi:cell division septal protein FtsQ